MNDLPFMNDLPTTWVGPIRRWLSGLVVGRRQTGASYGGGASIGYRLKHHYEGWYPGPQYQRGTGPSMRHAWREHVMQWGKDLGRTIDYLETRSDIDAEKIAYMGLSLGGRMGGIMLAVEPRLRLGLLVIPGFSALPTLPEVDPFNFTSRVTVPVIMFSGRYDNIYPLETAARPMFNVLGTPSQNKRHVISETGHFLVWNQVVGETLAWMDRYLGAVEPSNPPK